MIDLYMLCAELKSRKSPFRQASNAIIPEIYAYLKRPSEKTADMICAWKEDFRYIYGDVATNLSSNRKLDAEKLLGRYALAAEPADGETVRLLFFSIQTYFSLLVKYIMRDILLEPRREEGSSYREIISGDFAMRRGVKNYCRFDHYCWPLYELDRGFGRVMEDIRCTVARYRTEDLLPERRPDHGYDHIKQIYEAVIPKELRHALGEFYTPDWLVESILDRVLDICAPQDMGRLSVIDPTCGSGTFLMQAIARKRKSGCTLPEILATVGGIDINPLAVLTARTNYLLSVLDLLDGGEITLPVFQADMVASLTDCETENSGNVQDGRAVQALEKADIVIGNPPWVNWEYMPEQYRRSSQHLWFDYGLLAAKGRKLSFSKEDISVLITYVAMDKLLKEGGVMGVVMRQGVFKSAQNGAGFRRFRLPEDNMRVIRVEDLSGIKVFEGAAAGAAAFFAKKGEKTIYPVPSGLWVKKAGLKSNSFGAYSRFREVADQVDIVEQAAMPASEDDPASGWVTAERTELDAMRRVLGPNRYRARTGVFTGGANAVYWVRINHGEGECVSVTNIVGRAKRKSEQITARLEKTFLFPMVKGGDVSRWKVTYDTYLLCPHTAETKMRPVPQEELADIAPETLQYLQHFRADLDGRRGFAGWEKGIQQQAFHAVQRVGAYTFSAYKVVWRYIATEFICAVIGSVDDPFLGTKPLLPNEKIMYVSTDDEMEAYYLCGVLSSTLVAKCVRSYMNPTSISAHVLEKLRIPDYDGRSPVQREIARLCREGHGTGSAAPYIRQIDSLVAELYDENESNDRTPF